jgi:hypothetical protein
MGIRLVNESPIFMDHARSTRPTGGMTPRMTNESVLVPETAARDRGSNAGPVTATAPRHPESCHFGAGPPVYCNDFARAVLVFPSRAADSGLWSPPPPPRSGTATCVRLRRDQQIAGPAFGRTKPLLTLIIRRTYNLPMRTLLLLSARLHSSSSLSWRLSLCSYCSL